MTDFWDPNTWTFPETATITLSTDGSIFTTVDADLYDWLQSLGPWSLYEYRNKRYARRTRRRGEYKVGGHGATVYMHQVIARRVLPPPPSPLHFIVDHGNGDGLLNTGANLEWATPYSNRINYFGSKLRQPDFLRDLDDAHHELLQEIEKR